MPDSPLAASPPDKYADIDVTGLSQRDAADYRQELYHIIFYRPELELEVLAVDSGADMEFYKKKLAEVDAYLATFTEKI